MNTCIAKFQAGDETGRQYALDRLHVLDSTPEPQFEKLTNLVQTIFEVPVAAISLIDRRRQWFKSIQGLDVRETSREIAFCDFTIRSAECLMVTDATLDDRFRHNPLVTGAPHIRSYLGAPILTSDGYALGALCAIDYRPRSFTAAQQSMLANFAGLAMNEIELRQIAAVDMLTGMMTRRAFMAEIVQVAQHVAPAALLYIDLDHFKSINDTYGHPIGDSVLQSVAAAISRVCDHAASVGRIGGEEFAVLLPKMPSHVASRVAERIRSAIEQVRIDAVPSLTVSASIGVACKTADKSCDAWMAAADSALYSAKESGRNCVRSAVHENMITEVPKVTITAG